MGKRTWSPNGTEPRFEETLRVLAHNLNNPLNAISGFSQLLQGKVEGLGVTGLPVVELAKRVREEASRGAALLSRLGHAPRLPSPSPALTRSQLEDRLREHLARVQERCPFARIEFKWVAPEGAWSPFLPELVEPLLTNAADSLLERKSDDEFAADLHILLDVELAPKKLRIQIDDNGVGLPEESVPYLGTPFFTTKAVQAGHLGTGHLRVTRLLSELRSELGGNAVVECEAGPRTFSVRIRAGEADDRS